VRDLPGSIKVGMQTRNEEQVILFIPIWIFPSVIDYLDFNAAGQKAGDKGSDLGLQGTPVIRAQAMIVHENEYDSDSQGALPAGNRMPM
jgi:hypothetical protein